MAHLWAGLTAEMSAKKLVDNLDEKKVELLVETRAAMTADC